METRARIIYLETEDRCDILLSKKEYPDWRAVSADYPDYKTDLGPWCCESIIAFFAEEYPNRHFFTEQEIRDFFAGSETVLYAE